jgi:hypothetical protein
MVGTADKDYFLDAEGNVTTDEEAAHQLLIREGQDVPKEMADKYGIGKVAQTEEETAEPVKKAAKSSENKAEKAAENKSK